jgi:rsbT antagonist protein RsbS
MTTNFEHEDTSAPVPIIRLWSSLLVPLQGDLTDAQATVLSDEVLRNIERRGCNALIIDASGLWLVDSHLCSVIADLARSASLMGTRTILSGLQPEVALTLLAMDVALESIETALNLEQALESIGIVAPQSGDSTEQIFELLGGVDEISLDQEVSSE